MGKLLVSIQKFLDPRNTLILPRSGNYLEDMYDDMLDEEEEESNDR